MNSRYSFILKQLRSHGRLSVHELSVRCGCSPITVRRALAALEAENLVVRTPGGAMPVDQVSIEVSFPERVTIHAAEKARIAAAAADGVADGQVLLLDNGSSVYLLTDYLLEKRNLTIITFFLPVVNKLVERRDWKVILAGGQVRYDRGDLTGPLTEEFMSRIHADVAFFGADGLDAEGGVWTVDPESARMTQRMCGSAARRVLLADSSKLGSRAAFAAARWSEIDRWITDRGVDAAAVEQIRKHNVTVDIV